MLRTNVLKLFFQRHAIVRLALPADECIAIGRSLTNQVLDQLVDSAALSWHDRASHGRTRGRQAGCRGKHGYNKSNSLLSDKFKRGHAKNEYWQYERRPRTGTKRVHTRVAPVVCVAGPYGRGRL